MAGTRRVFIDGPLISRVKALASDGRTRAQIANDVGVSERTVGRILATGPQRGRPAPGRVVRNARRCPTCGGNVELPCKLCALRAGSSKKD